MVESLGYVKEVGQPPGSTGHPCSRDGAPRTLLSANHSPPPLLALLPQPVMIFNPAKVGAASREFLERGVAVVVVGFPATPLLTARMRVCISASHTREDLDFAMEVFEDVADHCLLRYMRGVEKRPALEDGRLGGAAADATGETGGDGAAAAGGWAPPLRPLLNGIKGGASPAKGSGRVAVEDAISPAKGGGKAARAAASPAKRGKNGAA